MDSPFIRKLRHGARLTDEDSRMLQRLASSMAEVGPRQDILVEDEAPRALTLILSGWACQYKQFEDGRRQILQIYLPGDLCEPYGILPRFMDHSLATLTAVTMAQVRPSDARAAAKASPGIEEALWWDALIHTAMLHGRIASLGCRSSTERLAHFLCELHARLDLIGLSEANTFEFPITQAQLGEVLGLSSVHVNRTIQNLRVSQTVSLRGKSVMIHDLARLRAIAQFDPAFLHLRSAEGGRR